MTSECLQTTENDSQSGFYFEGSRSDYGFFDLEAIDLPDFESTNTGGVTAIPDISVFDFVATGTCGF